MALEIKSKVDENHKHSNDISCFLYYKTKLYSASDDGHIKLWSKDLKLLATAEAHPCSVFSLTASDDTLYSCSNDGTIKAWTLDLKEKGLIYKGESEIWKIVYQNETLYAGDDMGDIMLFRKDKYFCGISTLEPVKDMIIINNIIYAIRDVYLTIVETNIKENGKGLFNLIKSVHGRGPISLAEGKLFFMDREGRGIVVIESSRENQYKDVTTLKNAHDLIINSISVTNRNGKITIFTGGWDKVVKGWKLTSEGEIVLENVREVDFPITVLTTSEDGKLLFVGGNDGNLITITIIT